MRRSFSLFQSHIDLAHGYWQRLLSPGDLAVDATCGNGHDTLILAQAVGSAGCVLAFDVQEQAISSTRARLADLEPRVELCQASHAELEAHLAGRTPQLIVYNLGYLPGGDKALTTQVASTLASVEQAVRCLAPGGCISLTCYPGHPEGAAEEKALIGWLRSLPPEHFSVSQHCWQNRRQAPSLVWVQRALPGSG